MKRISSILILLMLAAPLMAADSYELKWEYSVADDSLTQAYAYSSSGRVSYDYDGDGYPDVSIITGNSTTQKYQVHFVSGQTHNLMFAPLNFTGYPSVSLASDLDQDGENEFIVSNYTYVVNGGQTSYINTIAIYSGVDGSREYLKNNIATKYPIFVSLTDFDKDGRDEFCYTTVTAEGFTFNVFGAKGAAQVRSEGTEVPRDMMLRSYPNPFNADTKIAFTLATPGAVQMTLFDVTGRAIAIRRMDNLPAGETVTTLSALTPAHLPSGTYYVDIAQDNSGVTRQIVKLP